MEKFENHQHSRNNFFDNLRQRGHSPNTSESVHLPALKRSSSSWQSEWISAWH
jgi:hypothetical protein